MDRHAARHLRLVRASDLRADADRRFERARRRDQLEGLAYVVVLLGILAGLVAVLR